MKQTRLFLSATLLSLAVFIHAQNDNNMNATTFSTAQQEVLSTIEEMTHAFHQKDIEGVMSSYEPEALVVFEPKSPITDHNVLREMFLGAFQLNPHFEFAGHEVFITGNTAIHLAPWTMTGTTPDGQAVQQSGLSVGLLRKQADGSWLFVVDNPHGGFLLDQ